MPARRFTLVLLILYLAAALLTAVKFLPGDSLAVTLPYHYTSALSHILLHLTLLSGLVAMEPVEPRNSFLTRYTPAAWKGFVALSVIAAVLGMTQSRIYQELPFVLDVAQLALLTAFAVIAARRATTHVVWLAGLGVLILSTLLGLMDGGEMLREQSLTALVNGLQFLIAYPLMAFALVERDDRLYGIASALVIGGSFTMLSTFDTFSDSRILALFNDAAVLVIPAALLALVWFSRAVRSGWTVLALVLLASSGVLAVAHTLAPVIQGTRLTDLQFTLTSTAVLVLILARLQSRFAAVSFWLIAAGSAFIALMLGGAGLVQVYMERLLSLGYLDTQTYLIPLYTVSIAGFILLIIGALVFAARQGGTHETLD